MVIMTSKMRDESGYDWDDNPNPQIDVKVELCVICGATYHGFGHNAEPLKTGRCCDRCNVLVINRRLENLSKGLPRDHR